MAALTGWTQVADPAVVSSWRRGPRWWHVVVALVDDPALVDRRARVAELLGDLIISSAPDHPHVTVWVSGAREPRQVPDGSRIPLTITGADLFSSAAYLAVHSPELVRVRADLAAANPPEDRTAPFVPHVTVGVFQRRVPLDRVRAVLTPAVDAPPLELVGTVRHRLVDTRSADGALIAPGAVGGDRCGSSENE